MIYDSKLVNARVITDIIVGRVINVYKVSYAVNLNILLTWLFPR